MDWLGLFIAAVTTATLVAAWLTLRTSRRSFTWMKRSRQEDRAPLVTAKLETGWSPARKATLNVEVVNESTFDVVVRSVEFCVSGLKPIRFRSSIGPAVPLDAGAHRGYVMEIERDSLSSRLSGRAAKDVWIDVRSNTAELCRIDGGEIIEKLSKLSITA